MTNNGALLDIAKLYSNPAAVISIVHPGNIKTTVGLVESDFGFDISSVFNSEDQMANNPASNLLNAASNTTGIGAQSVVANIRQTVSQWTGSTRPTFQVPLSLVAYDPSIDIVGIASDLVAACAFEFGPGGILKAPGGYGVRKATADFGINSFDGTWTLQIGRWFRATGLVLVSCAPRFSKETHRGSGKPIFANLTLTFTPAILPDKNMVKGWFIQ